MRRIFMLPIVSTLFVTLLTGGPAAALEQATQTSAASLLGADVKGDNWAVGEAVQSDGFVWIFTVNTSYGAFQVNGLRRMKDRVQELRALALLEKMSRTKAFTDAVVRAGLAPIRFGRDLVLDPVETVGNLFSGVGKMFDTVVDGAKNPGGGRDPLLDSLTGVTKVERELAQELKIDPYSDYSPLRAGLKDVARVTALGSLPVTVGISFITGGVGIAASSASTASDVSATVYSSTAREVLELVTKKLTALRVDATVAKKFVGNPFYSPADAIAIAEALEALGATNADAFIENAATAASFDAAKFNRYRAELLARDSARLGTLKAFVPASGFALNVDAAGRLVAAYPFDTLFWTEPVSRNLTRLSAEVDAQQPKRPKVFASAGALSPTAQAELKKLGWQTMKLD
jgi:hypothetical protein